jgi:hypothetical protein
MNVIIINLPLIDNIEILVKDSVIAKFIERQLSNYIVDTYTKNIKSEYEYIINIYDKTYLSQIEYFFNRNIVLGRSHKIKNNKAIVPNFEYIYRQDKMQIICNRRTKWYKKFKKLNYRKCNIQFYNNVLFPIFSLYSILDNYILIHGSIINYKNKNIIISGLDGVGKSSISSMMSDIGAKLYADNFVLFNGKYSLPVNLAIRLYDNQSTKLKVIYKDNDEKLKEVISNNIKMEPIKVDEIYFLNMADKLDFSAKTFANPTAWFMFCNIAPEIRDANLFVAPFIYKGMYSTYSYDGKFYNLAIPKNLLEEGVQLINDEH